jgi:hypothetical protein
MKIRALKKFEGIKDLERDVFPKEGDVWEVSKERAEYLKSHGVIEIAEEEKKETLAEKIASADKIEVRIIDESTGKIYEQKPVKKKKHSKE